jgi:uncharacterized protein (TIGR03118 family)
MNTLSDTVRYSRSIAYSSLMLGLAACGGGGGGGGYGGAVGGGGTGGGIYGGGTPGTYSVTALVSNGVPAKTTDASLVNPWGIAFLPGDFVWVANNGSQTSTLYDGNGQRNSLKVAIPSGSNGAANPTGVVANTTASFSVKKGNLSAPATFLFAGLGGTITGWTDAVDPNNAIIAYDDAAGNAVYTGLVIAESAGEAELYAADFHNNKIDQFDTTMHRLTLPPTAFIDPTLPAGYAPFNVQAVTVNGATLLYVAYAKQQGPNNNSNVDGAGLGLVDVFDTQGAFKMRLINAGAQLNAPWGMTVAPANFGTFSGDLLIGNFGDGRINAFDPVTGAFKGTLNDGNNQPMAIPGLWGIAFGNGAEAQPVNTLFYAAGANNGAGGLYGRIDAN